jgi:transposase
MNSRYYPLTEEAFKREIEPLIASHKNRLGRPSKVSLYQFFCAVLYVMRTGVPWRDLPPLYGHWHTIYTRFNRWSKRRLFLNLLQALQQKKRITLDFAWIDSTTVCLHRHGGGPLKKMDLSPQGADVKA